KEATERESISHDSSSRLRVHTSGHRVPASKGPTYSPGLRGSVPPVTLGRVEILPIGPSLIRLSIRCRGPGGGHACRLLRATALRALDLRAIGPATPARLQRLDRTSRRASAWAAPNAECREG